MKSKIVCGPEMLMRVCELLRKSGIKKPTVCDVASALDCNVREVIGFHDAGINKPRFDTPIMTDYGEFIDPEWHRQDQEERKGLN